MMAQSADDGDFIDLFDRMKEVDLFGDYYYFSQETRYMFLESVESAKQRLEEILSNSGYTEELRGKARALIPVVGREPPR